MNKKLIALAVSAGLAMPGLASAVEVAGKALQIYGQGHVSIDSATTYDASGSSYSKLNMSSNSSRLGFKGEGALSNGLTGFYKIEDGISFVNGDAHHTALAHRAAIVGMKGNFGSLALGYQDSVYKDTFKKFDVMFNSIGDSRNILGEGKFDVRTQNGIYYYSPKMGGIQLGLGYSTAWKGDSFNSQNNNNESLTDAVLSYSANGLFVAAGYEQQKLVDNGTPASVTYPTPTTVVYTPAVPATGDTIQTITGNRLEGGYKTGAMDIRAIYEHVTNSGTAKSASLNRNAYGVAFVYKMGGSLILQYMKAATSDVGNDGANQITVGYAYPLAKNSKTYIMYDKVSNDAGANYGIGAGHDLHYTNAVSGKDVSAISIGYVYKF